MQNYILTACLIVSVLSCTTKLETVEEQKAPVYVLNNKADSLVASSIEAYGGELYNSSKLTFNFRGADVELINNQGAYSYTRSKVNQETGQRVVDLLTNDGVKRMVDGIQQDLTEKEETALTGSVNSVAYFTLLPGKLTDPAVEKKYIGRTTIGEAPYEKVLVTFKQEGGGIDHQDSFLYYISPDRYMIDFIAYNYHVNGGGARFRKAIDRQTINGLTLQNYENYDADTVTQFISVEKSFESGLKQLKRIENKDITVKPLGKNL